VSEITTGMDSRIAKIKDRLGASTPGQWFIVLPPWKHDETTTWVIAGSDDPHVGIPVCQPFEVDDVTEEEEAAAFDQANSDMIFIAHAKEDIEWLLEQLSAAGGRERSGR